MFKGAMALIFLPPMMILLMIKNKYAGLLHKHHYLLVHGWIKKAARDQKLKWYINI